MSAKKGHSLGSPRPSRSLVGSGVSSTHRLDSWTRRRNQLTLRRVYARRLCAVNAIGDVLLVLVPMVLGEGLRVRPSADWESVRNVCCQLMTCHTTAICRRSVIRYALRNTCVPFGARLPRIVPHGVSATTASDDLAMRSAVHSVLGTDFGSKGSVFVMSAFLRRNRM